MANSLTTNPMEIDTAGTSVLLTDILYVSRIVWQAAAGSAADQAIVQDQNGNDFAIMTANGANYKDDRYFGHEPSQANKLNGLKVPTLATGKILIHLL